MKPFTERQGITQPKPLQVNSMDRDLRVSLWNVMHSFLAPDDRWHRMTEILAVGFVKFPYDELSSYTHERLAWFKHIYFGNTDWGWTYNVVEFVVDHIEYAVDSRKLSPERFQSAFNLALEREAAGYRFIHGKLAPITNDIEIQAIAGAIAQAQKAGMTGANEHLKTALGHLSAKPTPDYRNSVKESISAVESIAKVLGRDGSGLQGPLTVLANKTNIHGSLKAGFINLYGYTCDDDGIRHSILDDPNVGFDEAKFMLVSCSAFCHYLLCKATTAGLLKP